MPAGLDSGRIMSTALTPPPLAARAWTCRIPPNYYSSMLEQEAATWSDIQTRGGLARVCPGKRYIDPPWVKMPPQGRRFAALGSLVWNIGLADGNDHLIPFTLNTLMGGSQAFIVPNGYDGCIVSVVFNYTGVGFNEGSGDLTWRLRINQQRYAKDYGEVKVQIGSQQTPYNINSGQILLQSGNFAQVYVNIAVAAGGNLAGGTLIGSIFGWTWPR